MAINELRSITTFIKAAELGSLRKAAADLGISPQAASKALAQLEAHLGEVGRRGHAVGDRAEHESSDGVGKGGVDAGHECVAWLLFLS